MFGELQVVVPASIEITADNMEDVIDLVWTVLEKFDHDKDYVLLSGDPVVIATVCAIASEMSGFGDTLRVLRWDRLDERYIQFDLSL
jgi:3-polyprenyl-4-hydroxybenzoate decarboxylase